MAVSQISLNDNDIKTHQNQNNQHDHNVSHNEKKEEPNRNFDTKKSIGMDELMSSLTKNNPKPAGKVK